MKAKRLERQFYLTTRLGGTEARLIVSFSCPEHVAPGWVLTAEDMLDEAFGAASGHLRKITLALNGRSK